MALLLHFGEPSCVTVQVMQSEAGIIYLVTSYAVPSNMDHCHQVDNIVQIDLETGKAVTSSNFT